jgi:divalent metal cation (Fe/Co/Zn/Cd) transporter
MERQTSTARMVMRLADFGLPMLLFAAALYSGSLSLIGLSIAGLALAAREALGVSLPRKLSREFSHYFQYGLGKVMQAGNLFIALCATIAGFWLAGEAFGRIVSGVSEISPLGFALAATTNALVAVWHGVLAYGHVAPFDRATQVLLGLRRRVFTLLVTVQAFLTIVVLAKDPEIAHWVDTFGATVVSLIIVGASLKLAWDCVCDLVDHPLDKEQEAAITTLLYREGVQPEEFVDLRTRRCGQQVFAELTLRMLAPMPMEEARQRLADLRHALATAVADLDLVIKLQDPKT